MATRIHALRDDRRAPHGAARAPALTPVESPDHRLEAYGGEAVVDLARRMYELRRRRDAAFVDGLFSEPAWDILLHLFIAGAEGRVVSAISACDGAAAPQTTALRKLKQLQEARLIVREGDPENARRSYVRLTYLGCRKMRGLLKGGCPKLGHGP